MLHRQPASNPTDRPLQKASGCRCSRHTTFMHIERYQAVLLIPALFPRVVVVYDIIRYHLEENTVFWCNTDTLIHCITYSCLAAKNKTTSYSCSKVSKCYTVPTIHALFPAPEAISTRTTSFIGHPVQNWAWELRFCSWLQVEGRPLLGPTLGFLGNYFVG